MYQESFGVLLVVCSLVSFLVMGDPRKLFKTDAETPGKVSYVAFRNQYLVVYWCVMMSDWLQGPYVYALYKSYGYDMAAIGQLFIVGFLSSATFGTVISSFADK